MPDLSSRGSIALAAVAVALLWPRPAAAQVGPPHGHGTSWNNLVTGTYIEITDQAKAERRLEPAARVVRLDGAVGRHVITQFLSAAESSQRIARDLGLLFQ